VNLSNAVGVVMLNTQGTCTITNDDYTMYVRHGGSDANGGGGWNDAFATLNKAFATADLQYPSFSLRH